MSQNVTYLAVKCKTKDCEYVIELGPLRIVEDRRMEFPTITEPTKIRCSRCGQTHEYQNSDTIHFERPIP